jgi:hypothetical protein
MNADFVPQANRLFLTWLKVLLAYLELKYAEWRIPRADIDEINLLMTKFEHTLSLTEDPATRTPVTVQENRDARKAVESKTRIVIKAYITYNPAVTNGDREAMGLPIHKTTRTRVPVIESTPKAEIKWPSEGVVEIIFSDSDILKGKAKPKGAQGVETCFAILDTPPADWTQLINSIFATHNPIRLTFDGRDRGKTMYFALRWENTRGEKGPWSAIFNTVIP